MAVPDTTEAPLVITLFGPMQARVEGRPLPHLRSRKTLWLLALLTLRPDRPVAREWLTGMLWPDTEQSQAFANLRPALSELRRALGTQGVRLQSPTRHTLLLHLEGAEADVVTFDGAIESAKSPDLKRAVALYQGPLLEGCLEEWVHQERAAREQSCLRALLTLAEASLITGDYAAALGYYRRAADIDPLCEAARRGCMEALVRGGDRNAALQIYRDFAELLRRALNAAPDGQTTALYMRLRAEARQRANAPSTATEPAPPPSGVTGWLPHPLTDLVGREDERVEVALRLRRSRLVTLTGPGGIGKTRLAIAVAAESALEYPDGVWLAALETLGEARALPRLLAGVLGLREEPVQSALSSVTDHLRSRRLLLVVDNCEHLLEASAQTVGHLLKECVGLRILATSRAALGITGETVWAVPALATPDLAHLPHGRATLLRVLMGYESVQLFVERAQAMQKTFTLTGDNAQAVARICSRLEGIPLALELAAARVRALTVEQIADRLHDRLGLLTGGSRTALSRQQTLRATLDWSHTLLNEPERILLRRLAVFSGGWQLAAAETVCVGTGITDNTDNKNKDKTENNTEDTIGEIEEWQVLNLLTGLVDKSLVIFTAQEPEAEARYRLLETIRQYALENLRESGEVGPMKAAHRNWCVALAEQADRGLSSAEQATWLRRLEAEHDNLRAALTWQNEIGQNEIGQDTNEREATGQETETDLRLMGALWRFWDIRGHHSEGRQRLEHALKRNEAQTHVRGKALTGAGALAYRQGDYAAAWALHNESLGIQRVLGNKRAIAAALSNMGSAASAQGDAGAARALQEESLSIHRELGNSVGIADSLGSLSNVVLMQGDYAAARVFQEESLALRRGLGDERGITWSLEGLGVTAILQDDYAAARPLLKECLSIRRRLEDKNGIAFSLSNLGYVAIAERNPTLAQALFTESLTLSRELENKQGIIECLEGLAAVMLSRQEARTAVCLLGAANALRERLGSPIPPGERQKYDRQAEQARSLLGASIFSDAWKDGSVLPWKQAADYALENCERFS